MTASRHIAVQASDDVLPVYSAPYQGISTDRQFPVDKMNMMLREVNFESATTQSASPVILGIEKNGSLRYFTDNRKLNGVTPRDLHPPLRIDGYIDQFRKVSIF